MNKFPLQVGKPVSGKDLIGRESEIEEIIQLLSSGQSVVLVAPRRFGKTSLILEILNRMSKDGYYTIYTDIFATPDLYSLASQLTAAVLDNRKFGKQFRKLKEDITSILKNVEFRQEIEDYAFVLKFNQPGQNAWELFERSIDFVNEYPGKFNKKLVAGLDEFGDIYKLNGDSIVKFLRSKIQAQNNTVYLFSGSYESIMDGIFVERKSPFYRLTRIVNLGYIEKDVFKNYLIKQLESIPVNIKPGYIDEILGFTNGHPYYTQLFLQELIIGYKLSLKESFPLVHQIIDRLLIIEKNYLEKNWEELGSRRESRIILIALAERPDIIYSRVDSRSINISRTLKKLVGQGVLFQEDNKYYFADPLFRYWIRKYVLKIEY